MSQHEQTFNSTLIYKHRSEALQLLPAKSYKTHEASQRTRKVTILQTTTQNPSD